MWCACTQAIVAKHVTGYSIFSTIQQFRPNYGLLLELHALTVVACSYALLVGAMVIMVLSHKPLISLHVRTQCADL